MKLVGPSQLRPKSNVKIRPVLIPGAPKVINHATNFTNSPPELDSGEEKLFKTRNPSNAANLSIQKSSQRPSIGGKSGNGSANQQSKKAMRIVDS